MVSTILLYFAVVFAIIAAVFVAEWHAQLHRQFRLAGDRVLDPVGHSRGRQVSDWRERAAGTGYSPVDDVPHREKKPSATSECSSVMTS